MVLFGHQMTMVPENSYQTSVEGHTAAAAGTLQEFQTVDSYLLQEVPRVPAQKLMVPRTAVV